MAAANRRGFTIIELLAVVTIIGILASLALPRYSILRERAFKATMIEDLKNLMTMQEGFFFSHGDYAGGITLGPDTPGLGGAGRVSMRPSDRVTITVNYMSTLTRGEGWNATALHASVTSPQIDNCGIFMGHPSYSPNAAVTSAGVVACW
jgi:prepilin-type N-terminal cleavage/methylation domain-containing protein